MGTGTKLTGTDGDGDEKYNILRGQMGRGQFFKKLMGTDGDGVHFYGDGWGL